MKEEKWNDIKVEIIVKRNELIWKSNVDIPTTIFYLDRTKYLIHKDMEKLDKEIVKKLKEEIMEEPAKEKTA